MSKLIYINPPKKPTNVAQVKLLWFLLDAVIGIPVTILGIFANLDNFKSLLIGALAICYAIVRIYFTVIQKKQAVRKEEIEIKMKELKYKMDQLEFDRRTSKVNGK